MNRKNLLAVMLIGLVAGAAAGGTVTYLTRDDDNGSRTDTAVTTDTGSGDSDNGIACTMEAKQCPDGSYVGRVGPDCEFAPCPELPPVEQADDIKVSSPAQGALVGNPVTISGEARVFESSVSYRVLDGDGTVLAEGFTMAASPDVGQFGPYSVDVLFDRPLTTYGKVEVFNLSARDGSVENLVTVIVQFQPTE